MTSLARIALLTLAVAATASARQTPPRTWSGTVGSQRVHMTLRVDGASVEGTYSYDRVGKPLRLAGTRDGAKITLDETDASGMKTGTFAGEIVSDEIFAGRWTGADGIKDFAFVLRTEEGARRFEALRSRDRVSGEYRLKDGAQEATLDVQLLDETHILVDGEAVWVGNAKTGNVNVGQVDGVCPLRGSRAVYDDDSDDAVAPEDRCTFAMTFGASSLTVADDNFKCGGVNVTFDGRYRRVGPPRFEER